MHHMVDIHKLIFCHKIEIYKVWKFSQKNSAFFITSMKTAREPKKCYMYHLNIDESK